MGLLSFIGDAFNDIFGGNSSREDAQGYNLQNMAIQQQYAERNMQLQNEYNIQAFNRENEYNSPVAQKLRNYQAGINPNWQDGSGVVAQQDSGVSASAPSGGMPSGSNVGGVADILNLVKLGKDMKKIDSDIDLQDSQTGLNKAEAHLKQTEADNMESKLPLELPNISANTEYLTQLGIKTDKEAQQVFTYARRYSDLVQSQVELNDKQIAVIEQTLPKILIQYDANIKKAYAEAGLASYMPKYYEGQNAIGRQNANTASYAAYTDRYRAETDRMNYYLARQNSYYDNLLKKSQSGYYGILEEHEDVLKNLDDIRLRTEKFAEDNDWTRGERRTLHKTLMTSYDRAKNEIQEIISRKDLNNAEKNKKIHDIIKGYIDSTAGMIKAGASVMDVISPF